MVEEPHRPWAAWTVGLKGEGPATGAEQQGAQFCSISLFCGKFECCWVLQRPHVSQRARSLGGATLEMEEGQNRFWKTTR